MSECISRESVINAIMDLPNDPNGYSGTYDKETILSALEDVPAIDNGMGIDSYEAEGGS